jgi:hypothetical protein
MRRLAARKLTPKKKFSCAEDDRLKQLVEEKGTDDWLKIASHMSGRDSRQCKERWQHYLAPDLLRLPWTQADEALLESKVAEHGRTWKMFESYFPGRTHVHIKNRYTVLSRRRLRRLWKPGISRLNESPPVPRLIPSERSDEDCSLFDADLDCLTDGLDGEDV